MAVGASYLDPVHLAGLAIHVEGQEAEEKLLRYSDSVQLPVVELGIEEGVSGSGLAVDVPAVGELFHLVVFRLLVDLRHRAGGISQEKE